MPVGVTPSNLILSVWAAPFGGAMVGLEEEVRGEATKLIRRHQMYAQTLHDELRRRERRTGVPQPKTIQVPPYWAIDRGFNPYKMRPSAHKIARAIADSIRSNDYSPRCAAIYQVPKSDG